MENVAQNEQSQTEVITEELIAQCLYEHYCQAVGGKAFNGDSLPSWQEFSNDPNKTTQSLAWLSVGARAIEMLSPNFKATESRATDSESEVHEKAREQDQAVAGAAV